MFGNCSVNVGAKSLGWNSKTIWWLCTQLLLTKRVTYVREGGNGYYLERAQDGNRNEAIDIRLLLQEFVLGPVCIREVEIKLFHKGVWEIQLMR